jgi:signal peptidase I
LQPTIYVGNLFIYAKFTPYIWWTTKILISFILW